MKVNRRSLRFRLFLMTVIVSVIAVGSVGLFSSHLTILKFQQYVESDAETVLESAREILAEDYSRNGSLDGAQAELERLAKIATKQFILLNTEGRIIATSGGSLSAAQIEVAPNHTVSLRWPEERARDNELGNAGTVRPFQFRLLDVPHVGLQSSSGVPLGTLYLLPLSAPDSERKQAVFASSVNRSLLWAALAAICFALIVAAALSRRILRPVEALTTAVRRMGRGDLSQRVNSYSKDEIGELTRAFNSMADSLARSEQLRRNMVNDIAHELRTPLTNIRCHLETLQDGLAEASLELTNSLYEEAMLLNRIVNDLQDLTLAESEQIRLQRQPMSLGKEIDVAVNTLRPQAAGRGVTLKADVPSDLPLIYADAKRVGQILRNLLNNALAHTPAGGMIEIDAITKGDEIEVLVRDTGEGIEPEHLKNIFERFYRTDQSRERATGGAGLGLAIVKQFVSLHGGRVGVTSTVGEGSAFVFTLPVLNGSPKAQAS
jgi:signal transduction histidine kinase